MEINIPFNKWSKKRLNDFTKNATSRNSKYGDPGDVFEVDNKRYKIVFVTKLPLWFISKYLWKTEGAEDQNEFIMVWSELHPKLKWTPNREVFYHYFEPTGGGLR